MSKDSSISLLKNRFESKEEELARSKAQVEKLNKSIKELTH